MGHPSARGAGIQVWRRTSAGFTMTMPHELRTDRLRLRRWLPADLAPFATLNADPRVSEYLPRPLSQAESNSFAARIETHFDEYGFGFWAVEICHAASFAGFIGLWVPRFESHFTPCVEIGWRFGTEHWGRGYATEGARVVLEFGFEVLGLTEIVSFTVPENARSRRVMEKIGMAHKASDDFDHPLLPNGHRLRRHVLYRIVRGDETAT